MKHPTLIIIVALFTHPALAQHNPESKEYKTLEGYTTRLSKELGKIDTTYKSKDSVAVVFTSRSGPTLKIEEKIYQAGCLHDSIVTHYNEKNLKEFEEYWTYFCGQQTSDENILCYRSNYSRWEYDSLGRVIKYVFHLSTPLTRRLLFSYQPNGSVISKTEHITDAEFWD